MDAGMYRIRLSERAARLELPFFEVWCILVSDAAVNDRICPGRHFAEASLFIMISSILHTLNIDQAIDEQGKPITPKAEMTYGVIS